jgi:hypothetical protein
MDSLHKEGLMDNLYLINIPIEEVSLAGISRKQQSITKLFPTFHDRVDAVGEKGGVKLDKIEPKVWRFKVHSGTKENKWYDVNFHIKDIKALIKKYVSQTKLWTQDKSHADLRKVARAIFFDADVQVSCSCPSFLYHGFDYITSKPQYDAKYGKKEKRPPNIKNPKQYGMLCKHLQALVNVLPFYITSIAKWLKNNYQDYISKIEELIKRTKKIKLAPKKVTKPAPKAEVTKPELKKAPKPEKDITTSSGAEPEPSVQAPKEEEIKKEAEEKPTLHKGAEEPEITPEEKEEQELKFSPKAKMFKEEETEEPQAEETPEEIEKEEEEKKLSPKAKMFKEDEEEDENEIEESVLRLLL